MQHTGGFGRGGPALECCRPALRPDTLRTMRFRRGAVAVLLAASACGGDGGSGPGPGDYFTQLQRVSETAHIQERGLRRDMRIRFERADRPAERVLVLDVFIGQSARLYQDVVDALRALEPPESVSAPHAAYMEAWQGKLDLIVTVREAGFVGWVEIQHALEASVFDDATAETRTRCEELQSAVAASGEEVDLACDGRPA